MYLCIITTIFLCLVVLCSSCELWKNGSSNVRSPRRSKRVVGGDKLRDRKQVPYKVIEYYVWIGNVHTCMEEPRWWHKIIPGFGGVTTLVDAGLASAGITHCPAKRENLVCGGALIAPKIVQTACHCLASIVSPPPNEFWGPAKVNSNFENLMEIYMGEVVVDNFQYPIRSDKFVVHQKCGQLLSSPFPVRFDIGWLVLDLGVPWEEGVLFGTWGKLDYAGPYRKQEIIGVYNTVVGQRHVCLVVGFGRSDDKSPPTRHMRQAWIQFLDWEQCYKVMYLIRGHEKYYTYNESASWICAQQLPEVSSNKFRGRHTFGDSGSPITCSNNYVALVSIYTPYSNTRVGFHEMLTETALYYALDANSVETRNQWEYELLRRPPSGELRILKIPSGQMLKHPRLENVEFKKG